MISAKDVAVSVYRQPAGRKRIHVRAASDRSRRKQSIYVAARLDLNIRIQGSIVDLSDGFRFLALLLQIAVKLLIVRTKCDVFWQRICRAVDGKQGDRKTIDLR